MASLLTDPLLEISGRGLPPNTNFHQFILSKSQVIWRWWKISARAVDRHSKPGEQKESHDDFLDDTLLQNKISLVFGPNILQFAKALCQGHYNYLDHLPDSLLLRIISYLELEDVVQLGQTSHRFRKLCGSEEFWEQAVKQRCRTISAEVASLALEDGWRSIFFTELHLQEEQQGGHISDPDRAKEPSNDSSGTSRASGSAEESPSDTICHPGPGSDAAFDTSSRCDVDSDPEGGSGSTELTADQFRESLRFCETETPAPGAVE